MITFSSVAESVAYTQKLFRNAKDSGNLILAQKQSYAVSARRIDDPNGETVPTKENRAGETARQGTWVIWRLGADGKGVMAKDGLPDQWVTGEKQFVKTYQVTVEVIEAGRGVVSTKTDNIYRMIQITDEIGQIEIQTPWNPLLGQVGDYLVNYNYDATTGDPGDDFAIVALDSWLATYEIV